MKYNILGGLTVPKIVVGCMRIADKPLKQTEDMIVESLKNGVNMVDHADIYGKGVSERMFGIAVKDLGIKRQDIILQSKCGIRPGFFDFSYDYILESVDGILRRLNTEYLDILLLHRPDALADPQEVFRAFANLQSSGKVRAFGVSNFSESQISLFRSYGINIAVNQVQFSLAHSYLVDEGLNVNMANGESVSRNGSLLNYCMSRKITLQAWSPLQYGKIEGTFLDNENFAGLNAELERLSEKYGVTKAAIALAWILRHPANMQVVTGTTTPARITELCKAADIALSREEWYALYRSTGKKLP
jgi:predicted oxidoreductase